MEDKNEELVCCPKYVYQKWYQILNWSAHVYSGIKGKKNEQKHILILFDAMWFKICADIQEMKGETRKKVVFMQEICYQFAKNLFSPSTAKIVWNFWAEECDHDWFYLTFTQSCADIEYKEILEMWNASISMLDLRWRLANWFKPGNQGMVWSCPTAGADRPLRREGCLAWAHCCHGACRWNLVASRAWLYPLRWQSCGFKEINMDSISVVGMYSSEET